MINSSGFLYNRSKKFQLMVILPDEYNKMTDFCLNIEIIINISSLNSCSNLFSSLQF